MLLACYTFVRENKQLEKTSEPHLYCRRAPGLKNYSCQTCFSNDVLMTERENIKLQSQEKRKEQELKLINIVGDLWSNKEKGSVSLSCPGNAGLFVKLVCQALIGAAPSSPVSYPHHCHSTGLKVLLRPELDRSHYSEPSEDTGKYITFLLRRKCWKDPQRPMNGSWRSRGWIWLFIFIDQHQETRGDYHSLWWRPVWGGCQQLDGWVRTGKKGGIL